jgi:CheY-like chemotaxis protein
MGDKVILLVEDNPDDEALMLRAFQRSKLANRIEVARDGAEALEFLLGPSARPLPTLVILDLKLPKVDGLEVLRRVRGSERTRTLPVVVLTSSREEQDLVESYRLGANSYVRKPVDFVQFAEATQTLGLYWLVVNEPPPSKERT